MQQGRLRDSSGNLVTSEVRAETLATHLERVQWAVRPATLVDRSCQLGESLPVNSGSISETEVIKASRRLKNNRAAGLDDVPGEFWKAVLLPGSAAAAWITEFVNLCWTEKQVPAEWHKARVVEIFKKGDPAVCDNYRPISLLAIGYKLFAMVLLQRLRAAGAEDRLWETQFGFRSKRGTGDALFIARRELERANSEKSGKTILLAPDWAKAFDSVSPDALSKALRRFGVPTEFVNMIQAIYSHRKFVVSDGGSTSRWHTQAAGISQGCPLSPFLFVCLMTVLMHDAKNELANQGVQLNGHCFVNDLVYADDTLLVDVDDEVLGKFMNSVGTIGQEYGLQFNWSKLEALPVNTPAVIQTPDNNHVQVRSSMKYLGSLLASDGRIGSELARRLGMARAEFDTLLRVWSHAAVGMHKKLNILDACVTTKLVYGLHTACLSVAESRRLDGFYVRCLRRVLRIPPSYYSRVSNASVLSMAQRRPISARLRQQRLLFFGELARRSDDDPVRSSVFQKGGCQQRASLHLKRGRPRKTWVSETFNEALHVAGSFEGLSELLAPTASARMKWRTAVKQHIHRM